MRRRLALVGLAVTALVVLTFLVPLGLLVRRQAVDRARVDAERTAQSTASLIALAITLETSSESIRSSIGQLSTGTIVALPDGAVLGQPYDGQGSLVAAARSGPATVTAVVDGGWEIALPVVGRDDVVVVDVMTTNEEMNEGVLESWLLLGLLGVVVVGVAVWVADRFGRWLVEPVRELEDAAHRLGSGDLTARALVDEPAELKEVGDAFNTLAARLDVLLEEEREAVADLSHRLRTPLTSLRLQSERLGDETERIQMLGHVDRLEQSIDQLIAAARVRGANVGARAALDEVVARRVAFWKVLAEEEGRGLSIAVGASGIELGIDHAELEAVADALIGNVFAHTDAGVSIWVATGYSDGRPWLEVADSGPGFPDPSLVERGVSGRGSTGLGLDIVRRTAESTGGALTIDDRPGGGAVVRVWFG